MSSIGPQLPPHLTKRKRTPDDAGEPDSPPSKKPSANQDEIAIDDNSSDDGYGPSIPKQPIGPSLPPAGTASKPAAGPSIGPSMGPTLPPSTANGDEISLHDSDSDSDTGPAPAPSSAPRLPPPPKRVLGPAAPPAPLSERPPGSPNSNSDDSDDDDYGPLLPTSTAHLARQSQALEAAALEAANPKAPQRDEWMLAPPTAADARAQDPTKIKARKFNSGPRSGGGAGPAAGGAAGEISSIWTETPEQKRQRLENAVLGRGGTGNSTGPQSSSGGDKKAREEAAKAEQIRLNLEAARGPSLYAEHQRREGGKGGRIEAEEDDPSKRGFDWEKDMRSGSKIGTAQRKELMNKAADFGGRFSKGKYL